MTNQKFLAQCLDEQRKTIASLRTERTELREALIAARKQLLERNGLDRDSDRNAAIAINRALERTLREALRLIHRDLGHISPKIFDEEISDEAKNAIEAALKRTEAK